MKYFIFLIPILALAYVPGSDRTVEADKIKVLKSTEITLQNNLDANSNNVFGINDLTATGTTTLSTGLTGPVKAASGVISAGNINLTSEVTGTLPIANGGTNSATALNNDRVIISSAGSIVESSTTTTNLSSLDTTTSLTTQLSGKQASLTGTDGDLYYWNSGLSNLGIGTSGQVLQVSGLGFPEWADLVAVSVTTKGDIQTHDASNPTRLAVGTDSQILSADSTEPTGLKWIDLPTSVSVTTKGDLQTHDGTNPTRQAVGANGTFLVADSAETNGIKWTDTLSGTLNPVTDWASFTPTLTNVTLGTGSTVKFYKSRVGDREYIKGYIQLGTGGSFTGTLLIDTPSSIDYSKLGRSSFARLDSNIYAYDSTAGVIGGDGRAITEVSGNQIKISAPSADPYNATQPFTWAVNDELFVNFNYPVLGWSSGVDAAITQTTIKEYQTTEIAQYTPVVTGVISLNTNTASWRRDGQFLEGEFYFAVNTTGTGTVSVSLPAGISGDFRAGNDTLGHCTWLDSGAAFYDLRPVMVNATTLQFFQDAPANYLQGTQLTTNDSINCRYRVPIVGWTATTTKPAVIAGTFENINSTDLVKVLGGNGAGTALTALVTDIDFSETEDNTNAWNGTQFTAPRTSYYMIEGQTRMTTSTTYNVLAYIGGIFNREAGQYGSSSQFRKFNAVFKLNQGDVLSLRSDTTVTKNGTSGNFINITELPDYEAIVKNLGDLKITNTVNDYSHFLEASNTFGSVLQLSNDGSTAADGYIYKDASDDLVIRNETSAGDVRLSTNGGQLTGNDGVTTGNIQFDCTIEVAASASARFLEQLCSGGRHAMSAGFSCGGNSAVTIGPCSSLGAGAICTDTSKSRWGLDCGATVTNPRLYVTCCKGGR